MRTILPLNMVCIAIGVVISTTAVYSLTQQSDRMPPVASIERTPLSVIETAFETLRASSIDNAVATRPRTQNSCNDFNFSFLHSTCSKKRRSRHAARMIHRVATFVPGHRPASPHSCSNATGNGRRKEGNRKPTNRGFYEIDRKFIRSTTDAAQEAESSSKGPRRKERFHVVDDRSAQNSNIGNGLIPVVVQRASHSSST